MGSDLCLKLELVDLVHSILPNLSDASHTILIMFGRNTNPSHPCELVFGPPVPTHSRTPSASKQSKAITPVHLTERRQNRKPTSAPNGAMKSTQRVAACQQSNSGQEISPIDVPPGTPATVRSYTMEHSMGWIMCVWHYYVNIIDHQRSHPPIL